VGRGGWDIRFGMGVRIVGRYGIFQCVIVIEKIPRIRKAKNVSLLPNSATQLSYDSELGRHNP